MTKKDFTLIARVLREARTQLPFPESLDTIAWIEGRFTMELFNTNPRFDSKRFINACRGEDSKDSAGRTVRYGSEAKRSTVKYASL